MPTAAASPPPSVVREPVQHCDRHARRLGHWARGLRRVRLDPSGLLNVVHVVCDDAARLRSLRLRALVEDPEAFGSTVERDAARPGEWWRQWAADSEVGLQQRTFVLEDGCTWRGLALIRSGDDGLGELLSMWVAPDARGNGAASQLIDACAAWARSRGLAAIRLAVFAGNPRACAAYERCGFTEVDRAEIVTDDGRSLLELRMRLTL